MNGRTQFAPTVVFITTYVKFEGEGVVTIPTHFAQKTNLL